jgi:hypothetical protein
MLTADLLKQLLHLAPSERVQVHDILLNPWCLR